MIDRPSRRSRAALLPTSLLVAALFTTGCGGGSGGGAAADTTHELASSSTPTTVAPTAVTPNEPTEAAAATSTASKATVAAAVVVPKATTAVDTGGMSTLDAFRLADQGSFGATEWLMSDIKARGAAPWVAYQMSLSVSRYTSGGSDAVHKNTSKTAFCSLPANAGTNCWRDNFSITPLQWDFYRNANKQPDQLRQRVAYALSQILVTSNLVGGGTYGFRNYHNMLLSNAFGNYRQLLKKVTLSPVMGDFLDSVDNYWGAPNENYARELMQLFAIGTCGLNADGSMTGGSCAPTYDNDTVRNYAYALTGWNYPAGGTPWWKCQLNCVYLNGDMVPAQSYHDTKQHPLLSGVTVPVNSTPAQALELVLDSLMQHPNMAPFVSKQLIQQLVTSNPSPAYVKRVAVAFNVGSFTAEGKSFGTGQRGDMAATIAAILLDPEARTTNPASSSGKLREPALLITGVLRALHGSTDGYTTNWYAGTPLRQSVLNPPSVFNFYPPDYPVVGTDLVGPTFGIHDAGTALQRLNYLTYLIFEGGSQPSGSMPGATGTAISFDDFVADAGDPAKLVDRFSVLATGAPLPAATRDLIIAAVTSFPATTSTWRMQRTTQAAYLVFATPNYQVQR